jgi:hypothetical protein
VQAADEFVDSFGALRSPFHDPLDAAAAKTHVFLYLVAYCIEWHMHQAWKPLLIDDEELAVECTQRDPVARRHRPPQRNSKSASV